MTFEELISELKNNSAKSIIMYKKIINTNYDVFGVNVPKLKEISRKCIDLDFSNVEFKYYEVVFVYFYSQLYKYRNDLKKQLDFIHKNSYLIDSWAITDSTVQLLKGITLNEVIWFLNQESEFEIRYGYVALLYFSKDKKNLDFIFNSLKNDDRYYVFMAEAWLISYCFIYHFEETYNFINLADLDLNLKIKGIQKSVESFRVSKENKEKLKKLRQEFRLKQREQ